MRVSGKSALDAYLTQIKVDLLHVESLLEDAATTLLAAFTNITEFAHAQKQLATELAAACVAAEGRRPRQRKRRTADGPDPVAANERSVPWMLAQQAALTDQIELQFDAIVRSLQSQDLSAQLLMHVRDYLAAVEAALGLSRETRAAGVPVPGGETAGSVHGDEHARRATAEIIAFPRSKAVDQRGTHTGDIELF